MRLPTILDEIQNVPEIFNFVRTRIDRAPRRTGQWFLTGSQKTGLMRNVTESIAGRARKQRDSGLMATRSEPFFDNLRGDPLWNAFLRTIGLADDQLK